MTHDLETTLNASVSSSPGNKKIWPPPVVQPLWGADAAGGKTLTYGEPVSNEGAS